MKNKLSSVSAPGGCGEIHYFPTFLPERGFFLVPPCPRGQWCNLFKLLELCWAREGVNSMDEFQGFLSSSSSSCDAFRWITNCCMCQRRTLVSLDVESRN